MQRHHIADRHQLVEANRFCQPGKLRRVDVGVVDDDLRTKRIEDPRNVAADRAVADQSDGAILQLEADSVVTVVVAAPHATA